MRLKKDRTRNARKTRWRKRHPEKHAANLADWRARNRDHWRAYMRRYRAAVRICEQGFTETRQPLAY